MRWAGHVAHWVRGEAYTGLWWGNLMERVHLEDRGIHVRKMDVQELGCGGMDWIEMAQDREI